LQKAVKAVENGVQKNSKDVLTRMDVIAWAMMFLFGGLVTFMIFQFNTKSIMNAYFKQAIEKRAEEPRKEAEAEAKRILAEAQKQAEAIIQEAQKK